MATTTNIQVDIINCKWFFKGLICMLCAIGLLVGWAVVGLSRRISSIRSVPDTKKIEFD